MPSTVDLNWNPNPAGENVTAYHVERKIGAGNFEPLASTAGTSYQDTVGDGLTVAYRVRAENRLGASDPSAEAGGTTPVPPSAPTGLTISIQGP